MVNGCLSTRTGVPPVPPRKIGVPPLPPDLTFLPPTLRYFPPAEIGLPPLPPTVSGVPPDAPTLTFLLLGSLLPVSESYVPDPSLLPDTIIG